MKSYRLLLTLSALATLLTATVAHAESRREGGGEDVLRKAQYMIRQLNQEKTDLQRQVGELQAKLDKFEKEKQATEASLAKSKSSNKRLMERVRSDSDKFKVLLERYRESIKTLRQANLDNQYLVKAVQEREEWIDVCRNRNQELFAANSDLLQRYKKEATRFAEPFTGISSIAVENEVQEYRFKLEDLQVTRFKPSVRTEPHVRSPEQGENGAQISRAN